MDELKPHKHKQSMASAQAHYDSVACSSPQKRTDLQKFHNAAKRALLEEFAFETESLLDLACGRGGDVHKWASLGIRHVTGLDISSESIREARRRCDAKSYAFEFRQVDLRKPWTNSRTYDVVTCMFALHYFFESEHAAHTLMRTVASSLRPGGVFIGIVPDGQCVNECIKHGPEYDNGIMHVRAMWQGKPACFGSAYRCNIKGTVTQESHVPEFLVYENVLRAVAAIYGLVPIAIKHAHFSSSSKDMFQHLVPPYGGAVAETSRLFAGFALKKFCSPT